MIDIRSKDREVIERLAVEIFVPGTELWVYGSRIKGTSHDASDLDLVVKFTVDTSLALEKLADFRQALHDSTIPIIIQVFSWDDVPESFREAIAREHEVMLIVAD